MTDDVQIPSTTDPLDEETGRKLVEAWRVSGMSGAAFCRLHNLRAQRLHYWRERLGYPIKTTGTAACASVARPPATDGFVQVVVRAPSGLPSTHVDIVVGHVVIRVGSDFDADLLRRVVEVLGSEPSAC
jgi:hypothetical protein